MFEPPRIWETERLIMKPATRIEASRLFDEYASNPDVSRYMTWHPHKNIEETEEFLRRCEKVWENRAAYPWSLWLKDTDSFVGMLEARIDLHSIEIGYVLAPKYWRQGLMSEAVLRLIKWAFRSSEIYRVWAVCDVENKASAGLLKNIGMQLEGTLRRWLIHPNISDSPRDCLCYSIVK